MRQKRQSYHDRYFADHQVVRVSTDNRKGYKIVYRYVGLWKAWQGRTAAFCLRLGLLEAANVCLYLCCGLVNTSINRSQLASGLGVVSIVPWLAEIYGLLRFLTAKQYVWELSMEETDACLRLGCSIRAVLVVLSAMIGIGDCLLSGMAGWQDWLVLAGLLASGVLSTVIRQQYSSLLILTFRNQDGNPGAQI
ncbi:MAG: hypothetical protein ACI4PO_07345 [Faecousia sp.]